MTMRLDYSAPKLANQLRATGQTEQRAAAIFASEFALLATPVDSLIIANALENLKKNRRHTQETSSSLKNLVTQLDNKYFELQENARTNPSVNVDYLTWFSKARSVSALMEQCH